MVDRVASIVADASHQAVVGPAVVGSKRVGRAHPTMGVGSRGSESMHLEGAR